MAKSISTPSRSGKPQDGEAPAPSMAVSSMAVGFLGEQNWRWSRGNRERYISQLEIQTSAISRSAEVSNSSPTSAIWGIAG